MKSLDGKTLFALSRGKKIKLDITMR